MSTQQHRKNPTSVVLAGVGGQGILLASKILAQAAMEIGCDVKTYEIHGMAQRGGSVLAYVRFGEKVYSPLVPKAGADAILSLERTEALRYVDYLANDGCAVVSDEIVVPVTVSAGKSTYPDVDETALRAVFPKLLYLNALDRAIELGNSKAANVVLIGALSATLDDLPQDVWESAVKKCVKPKFVDLNLQAFRIGREFAVNSLKK